jgi:starch phosphorylase
MQRRIVTSTVTRAVTIGCVAMASDPQVEAGFSVAFFSMEIALSDSVPTFSGGLGVLAGDFLRSAADLGLDIEAVTLLYRDGYFEQRLGPTGTQIESVVNWSPGDELERLDERVAVRIDGSEVLLGAWRRVVEGRSGARVPVYFLDTDLGANSPEHRAITDRLYAGGVEHRLRQEAVLGLGGPAMLRALGHSPQVLHMNEGHCSLAPFGHLEAALGAVPNTSDLDGIGRRCVFTTHTPVPAGRDRFERDLVVEVLGEDRAHVLGELGLLADGILDMTELGLRTSGFSNAVSRQHAEVTRAMFPSAHVTSVTNGAHLSTWVAEPVGSLLDHHVPGWRGQNGLLRYAHDIDIAELEDAHRSCKDALLRFVQESAGLSLDRDVLTIGLGRRATAYKRTTLLFSDPARLREIAKQVGPLQVVCSGKAHPDDGEGKRMIEEIFQAADELRGSLEVVFLENYDMHTAKLMCSGSDVWLNTPSPPHEASGTSGMKAAVNGVPSLSVLDGWWLEGWIEGVTGWSIGKDTVTSGSDSADDAQELYAKLADVVVPLFYASPQRFGEVRRNAIALNAIFFNTERMAKEYLASAYLPASAD